MSFSDRFGGSAVQPAEVEYRDVDLQNSVVLQWASLASDANVAAKMMDVTAASPGLTMTLPDATLAGLGTSILFNNVGANNFEVRRSDGSAVTTISPSQSVYVYLTDNSSAIGAWGLLNFGALVSALDLANSAGNGLVVASGRLAVSPLTSAVAGNIAIAATDRSKLIIWTGGTGTFTLPLSSAMGQFYFEVRNQGSGVLTLACSGGETIDSSASIALQLNESCLIHASEATGSWYTVGRGRQTQFAFTQLNKTVTGGTVVETLTEASNVVQTFTGVLTSNVDIVVPSVVQVYYVSNQTSGAFNFRVKNPGAGTTVSIPQGQNAVLFSDGTNVINASTTVAGIASLVLAAGTAASPSLGVGAINSGLYSSGSNEVAVSSNGLQVAKFDPTGLTIPVNGGQVSVVSATGNASLGLTRPAGSYGVTNYYTGANQRWRSGVNNTAESGSNAGSDFFWERYNDAGASLAVALLLNRATGFATFGAGGSFAGNLAVVNSGVNTAINATTGTGAGVQANTAGSTSGVSIIDTSSAHLKMQGSGVAKFIRVGASGTMEWINAAYTIVAASLTDTGTFTAVNVAISSDRRLKTSIKSTLWSSVFRLFRLRGVKYYRGGKLETGLISQEVDRVYPELVNKDGEFQAVNYTGLTGELVNSQKLLWCAVAGLFAFEVIRWFV
jgi:hypothetical protein